MFAFSDNLSSDKILNEFLEIEKELFSELGLHFRQIEMPTEELGCSAYRKYDMEAWIPSSNEFCEVFNIRLDRKSVV